MEEFFDTIKRFLGPAMLFLLFVGPALLKKKKGQDKRSPRRLPREPGGRSELEERVRRNFEDLMKRRAGPGDGSSETSAPTATVAEAVRTPAMPTAVPAPPIPAWMTCSMA